MKLNIYAMFDSCAKAFTRPVYYIMDAEAIRSFQDTVNQKDNPVSNHPDQFSLMHIGTFDDSTGIVEAIAPPRSLGMAIQYKDEQMYSALDVKQLIRDAVADITKAISEK